MSAGSVDPRLAPAVRVLRDAGFADCSVAVAGHEREIALVRAPEEEWDRLVAAEGAMADRLKALGFRYVAVDLAADPPAG